MLLNHPKEPRVPASETTRALLVLIPLMSTQFFTVSLTTGVFPTDPIQITLGVVVPLLVIVRPRSVPAPSTEPLIVTRLAPFNLISALEAFVPLTARATAEG